MKCIIISGVAVLIAFIWTILPLVGWNEYSLDVSIFLSEYKCILKVKVLIGSMYNMLYKFI
jgi:hypothetical protein